MTVPFLRAEASIFSRGPRSAPHPSCHTGRRGATRRSGPPCSGFVTYQGRLTGRTEKRTRMYKGGEGQCISEVEIGTTPTGLYRSPQDDQQIVGHYRKLRPDHRNREPSSAGGARSPDSRDSPHSNQGTGRAPAPGGERIPKSRNVKGQLTGSGMATQADDGGKNGRPPECRPLAEGRPFPAVETTRS